MGFKRCLWALGLVVAAGTTAANEDDTQKVSIYTSTNPGNHDPAAATPVLKTVPELEGSPQEPEVVLRPQCEKTASRADCKAAKAAYDKIQRAAETLGDKQLGPGGTLHVIMMKNAHPRLPTARGVYSNEHDTLVLYPSADEGTLPHEMSHIWFKKSFGFPCPMLPCSEAEIKKYGVDEGFAKIVAHRVAGVAPADAPSADNVADILAGTYCSSLGNASRAAGCAHDLGNLVFEAYERVASDLGADVAFDVYRKAMRKLKGGVVSPATLHKRVRAMLADRYRREMEDPPLDPDPFALDDWFRVLVEWGIPIVEVP